MERIKRFGTNYLITLFTTISIKWTKEIMANNYTYTNECYGPVNLVIFKHQFSVTIEPSFSRIVSDFDEIFYDCLFSCQNT